MLEKVDEADQATRLWGAAVFLRMPTSTNELRLDI
jgi:hypothetical protein